MILEAIATVLVENKLGVMGKTLFLHHMPETCKQGVVLRIPLSGIQTDSYKPGFYKSGYQAIVRDKAHESGQALADKVMEKLEFYNRDFADKKGKPTIRILQSYACILPVVYPKLPDNMLEWSTMFDIQYLEL